MENLTLLEQEALGILKQLEYRCDEFELHGDGKSKILEIMISDVDPRKLKRTENLYNIAKYLQKNGIDFSITFDLVNDFPAMYIDHEHPTEDFIQLGVIKGGNIQDIKTRIKELIHKLSSRKPTLEDENISIKRKRITHLPKFPRTDWARVSVRFIDDRSLLLSDSIETKPCVPESLGCVDERNGRPDDAWEFLDKVAKGQGATDPISKKEREKQKKQKQRITDILRKVFQNDTDPFETEKEGVYKTKFNTEYFSDERPNIKERKELLDLEEMRNDITHQ